MVKVKNSGITGSELKYVAILAMLIDHIAWAFVPQDTLAAQLMHALGRITAPVMCFFISEGYHYTKSLKKYISRMCIFALISHFAFNYYQTGSLLHGDMESVIATLTLSLVAVWVVNNDKIEKYMKLVVILLIMYFAQNCDWGTTAILFTLAFELARGNRKHQLIAYAGVCMITKIFPLLILLNGSVELFMLQIFNFGIFLPIPLLLLYNGKKGGGKATKWIFYVFYPAHLLVLGYLANSL